MEDVVLIVDIGIIQHYFKRQVNKGDVAWPPARQRCSKSLYYCIEKRKMSRISPNPSKTNKTTTTEWLNLKPKKWVTSVLNTPHPYKKISLTNVATELRFLLTSFVPKKWENVVLSSPRTADVLNTSAATEIRLQLAGYVLSRVVNTWIQAQFKQLSCILSFLLPPVPGHTIRSRFLCCLSFDSMFKIYFIRWVCSLNCMKLWLT